MNGLFASLACLLAVTACGSDDDGGADAGAPPRDAGPPDGAYEAFPPADRMPTRRTLSEIVGVASHPSDMPVASDPESTARRAEGLRRLSEAGVRHLRRDFLWREIEPEQGRFEWAAYDGLVDEAAALGISLTPLLVYGVGWANGDAPSGTPPDDLEDYGRFARAVAERFGGRVDGYEIWNEPNMWFRFWQGAGRAEPGRWADLCILAHAEIHAADPDAVVAPGGTFYSPQLIPGGAAFVSEALRLRPALGDAMDALAFHPYPAYPPQATPEHDGPPLDQPVGDKVRAFHGILVQAGQPDVELWSTELGWPIFQDIDQARQAAYTIRALLLGALAGADRWYVFNLNDGPDWDTSGSPIPGSPEDAFGIIRYDEDPLDATPGEPKQAYDALTVLLASLGTFRVIENVGAGASYVLRLEGAAGERAHAVWHATDDPIPTEVAVGAATVTVIGMLGASTTMDATAGTVTIDAGAAPVYVLE